MLAVAPMPSVSVSTATAANPGDLRRVRRAKRRSCQSVSIKHSQPAERTTSFVTSRLPCSNRTARNASLRLIPCRSEEHTSELQSHLNLVCRLLLEKKKKKKIL